LWQLNSIVTSVLLGSTLVHIQLAMPSQSW
jgi:hypothetical protein